MPAALTPIPRNDGKNMPGYRKLYLTPMVDVEAIPAAVASDVPTAITMVAAKVFVAVPFDPEAGCFLTIETPEAEGSTGYMYNLQGFIAGNTAAIRAAVETYDGVECIPVGELQDGTLEIIGEVGRGITLRFNFENGGKAGNRVGYAFTGKMDFNHLPYTYSDGTIAE